MSTRLDDLPGDAWAELGSLLDPGSLVAAGGTSRALAARILDNPGLWARQLRQQYPAVADACSGPWDWPAAFKATSTAACELLTTDEWSSSTVRPYPGNPPSSALLLVRRRDARPGSLAAALDQRLVWLHGDAAAQPGVVMSDPLHGHTSYVSVLVEVAATCNVTGYASGSLDQTIKLWTPFKASSRTPALLRPVRTLRGHTGSISALLCIPGSGSRGGSSGGSASAILASASADKTVKLWSLAPLTGRDAGSCPADAAPDAEQHGNTGSSSGRSSRKARVPAAAGSGPQQLGRNPLLATLRGHSDSVTDLLLPQPGAGCPGSLLSCGRDCRVKLWDIASTACLATWRLQGPCLRMVAGTNLGAAVLPVLTAAGIELLDTRQPGRPAAAGAGVLRLQAGRLPASGSLVCAAGHGCMVAAGGRRGVVVWDVRAAGSQQQGSSGRPAGGCGSTTPVLLSARMPHGQPVAALHMDRVKLVASTRRVVLNSGAGISVWRLPDGRRMQLSSTLTGGIDLQAVAPAAHAADGAAGIISLEDAWDLLGGMTEEDMAQALSILHHQQPGQQQQHEAAAAAPPAGGDEEEAAGGDDWQDGAASDGGDSLASSSSEDVADAGGVGGRSSAWWGRVEPGVVALAVDGPVIATMDTLGTIVLRDFAAGVPDLAWLQQQCRLPSSAAADALAGSTGEAAGSSDQAHPSWQASKFWQQPRA